MYIRQPLAAFLANPMGPGSRAIQGLHVIREDFMRRYQKIISVKKRFDMEVFTRGEDYYILVKVPSENLAHTNTYDVVFQFTTPDESIKKQNGLNNYDVLFFSNNPGFVFTYGFAFALNGLFVVDLEDRYEPEVFSRPPVTRNPGEMIGYEKSIFFAATYLMSIPMFLDKSNLHTISKPYNKAEFIRRVRHIDKIMVEIKKEQARTKREEEAAKRKDAINHRPRSTIITSKDRASQTPTTIQPIQKVGDRGKIGASRKPIGPSKGKIRGR